MEFTPDFVELLIEASERELTALKDKRAVQQPKCSARSTSVKSGKT
jgi:hypothetical protein